MLAATAAKKAGKNDRTAINDALAKIGTYEGISGPITFDENGDVMKPLSIVIVQDGALATAPQQPAPVSTAARRPGRGERRQRPRPSPPIRPTATQAMPRTP